MRLSPNRTSEDPGSTRPALNDVERWLALLVIGASAVLFAGLLAVVPARFQGFDEAKYLGIGLNVLRGAGALTVFGGFFEPHSPLWPVIMAAPRAWFNEA